MNRYGKLLALGLAVAVAGSAFAAGRKDGASADGKPTVAVSILPQEYFVSRISGGRVEALVLVGPGQNPHSYEPTPRQMAALSTASAWILSNTEFEAALRPKIAAQYPTLAIVDGTEGVRFRPMEAHDHDEEDHHEEGHEGDDHDDDHGEEGNIDRHTWLGKEGALILAGHIKETLIRIDGAGRQVYEENYRTLVQDVEREFSALASELASLRGKTVFVYHPAFGYFLDEFGIVQEAVEVGGKEPSAKTLSALIDKAKEEKPAAIFVQPQFSTRAAKNVADAVGAQVVALDDLAPDWLANIRRMGDALKKAAASVQ